MFSEERGDRQYRSSIQGAVAASPERIIFHVILSEKLSSSVWGSVKSTGYSLPEPGIRGFPKVSVCGFDSFACTDGG